MNVTDLKSGNIYSVVWPFGVQWMDADLETCVIELVPEDIFMLLDFLEIDELSVIECQILFANKQMWFNIHKNEFNIDSVRRAASYDIPFMTLQETELGSNNSIS